MKVKISFARTLKMWLITLFVGAIAFFCMFFKFFTSPWEWGQILFVTVYLFIMVLLLIAHSQFVYYEIYKKYVVVKKFNKEIVYNFKDIWYIDHKDSEKSKTVCFVTKFGHIRYLTFDKEGLIYKAMLEQCTNLLTLEEIKAKFPNIKI